ncbi:MFS general substrate transporter [Melanomma pulvis-pyrius CBS 109.77]|uniref:MFS general substrate transporter n=1 Tax=Melanomma pulvis-pyrius CBS 109.77 TaxID=1314802 RepID=A0A6A6WUG2_9PLEO|nr:MFS general substrate transporter [Melanomma pulvis-pyrius CBS 109.77]
MEPTEKPGDTSEFTENLSDNPYLTGWKLRLVTGTLMLGMFMVGVDSTIIGVVTPKITTAFHSMDDIAWYGSGYMLPHTVLQPTLGAVYRSFSVTWIYLISIAIFEVGSCLCAAAPSSAVFIVGRVIAGCGAAGVVQGTLSIVAASVPKKKVPLYYGYVLGLQAVSACTAPIFGGIFADKVSWRWCFYINLPFGGIGLLVVPWLIRPRPSNKDIQRLPVLARLRRMDWLGTLLFMGAFTCLLLALQWGGQTKPWNSSDVLGNFVGFGLLLCVFIYFQGRNNEDSLIPRRILKQRTVLFGSIYLIFLGFQTSVYLYYVPIYFQAVRGTSAMNSGVRMIALDAARILFIIISGALVTYYGYYMPYMIAGTAINAIGAGLMVTLNMDTSTSLSTAFMFIVGAGAGIGGFQPFTAIQAALSDDDLPIGNGLTVFGLQLGSTLAFSISQTLFLTKIFQFVENSPLTAGISRAAIVAAGASHIDILTKEPKALQVLKVAYRLGIKDTMIVALVAICLAHLCLPGMEWLKLGDKALPEQDSALKNAKAEVKSDV